MDTKQKIEELSMSVPEVHRGVQLYYHSGNYEKCLEMMVIALAEKSETLHKECVRLHMNSPVSMVMDEKDIYKKINRDAIKAKLGQ